jgi:hypothetical protein
LWSERCDMTLAKIYTPNDVTKTYVLWSIMIKDLPKDYKWLLLGDFNMVEHQFDKTNECGIGSNKIKKGSYGK